jgi:hypothetical protein
MASGYPGALDSFATNRTDATVMTGTHPADHNNENDAINKIEAELGVNPSGASATVVARLNIIHPPSPAAYTISNPVVRRTVDVSAYTMDQLAALIGTLIADLQARGIVG